MIPKFRAYIMAEKRHLPVDAIDFKRRTVRCYNDIDGIDFHPEYFFSEIVLEQWAGQTDTEGTEIYEGDRVFHQSSWAKNGDSPHQFTGDIMQSDYFVGLMMVTKGGCHSIGVNYAAGYAICKVIGTIHDEVKNEH